MITQNMLVVGAGGGGSWLVPALVRLTSGTVTLMDGDTLEHKNLDRQLFSMSDIGKNKAVALAERYRNVVAVPEWFHVGITVPFGTIIICCADNHPARKACLEKADQIQSICIILGNEYTDAEAYVYVPWLMKDTTNDPRVRFPEINTSHEGDPMAREMGCTGVAQSVNRQLVIANISAVDHALRLLWFWLVEKEKLPEESISHWPVQHSNSAMRCWTTKYEEKENQ